LSQTKVLCVELFLESQNFFPFLVKEEEVEEEEE